MKTAFFLEKKIRTQTLEEAMDWLITQAARFGMTGPEAVEKGYADIFEDPNLQENDRSPRPSAVKRGR